MDRKSFVKLVAAMREAEKRFWIGQRDKDDLVKSIELERRVDEEIKRVAERLKANPDKQPDNKSESWQFFCTVTILREKTKNYFIEKKRQKKMGAVVTEREREALRALYAEVRQLERTTDRLIQKSDDDEKRRQGIEIVYQVMRSRTNIKEPTVVLTTRDEKYANLECYGMNEKSPDGSHFFVKRIERQPNNSTPNT